MSDSYALVHDASREAFDLSNGPWYVWRREEDSMPTSALTIGLFLDTWIESSMWQPPPGWFETLTEAIWKFIETHPGCRIACDGDIESAGGGDWWGSEEDLADLARNRVTGPSDRIFTVVGDRREIERRLHDASKGAR